ncbi:hypothetical protein [Rhodococcus sp. (in: high G+C Gram-positive bacteria)]|uniref:hypothetical protein n=1 Tax=Rhodococcus sp. TaxID=1831 RepID=UPI00257DEB41|nr:hypothetical protein [Rhodococcus sp. (in: high G+C Gram-positive bacteria)]MBQ7803078.1 hypothetical protein [Rhodococcus sp. (in: high G+C Gram-positive bacteria)]
MTGQTILIVDRVLVEPGKARAFVDAYRADYVPHALKLGMTLDGILLSPPVWFDDDSNVVTVTWTVSGSGQWWQTAIGRRFDPAVRAFWAQVEPMIMERSRSMAARIEDVEEMCDV